MSGCRTTAALVKGRRIGEWRRRTTQAGRNWEDARRGSLATHLDGHTLDAVASIVWCCVVVSGTIAVQLYGVELGTKVGSQPRLIQEVVPKKKGKRKERRKKREKKKKKEKKTNTAGDDGDRTERSEVFSGGFGVARAWYCYSGLVGEMFFHVAISVTPRRPSSLSQLHSCVTWGESHA